MIEKLLAVLAAAGLEPEPRELRDALWLAGHIAIAEHAHEAVPPLGESIAASEPAPPPPTADESTPAGKPAPPAEATTGAPLYAASVGGSARSDLRSMEARSPAVPALRRQLQLARALRPFKRRVPSRTSFVVDENATAAGVAEEGIWIPVLRPASARWLDLALVIDTAPSMVVWRRTAAELRTLAERLGAFRTIRVFAIDGSTGPSTPLTVRPESLTGGGPAGLGREPATLIDPTHRQAILVVTDAVSDAWRDGRMDPLLRRWGSTAPLAVATVLPQRMWAGTGLRAVPAQLHAPTPGLANGTLAWRTRNGRGAAPGAPPIPVMELSARWLAQWAQLVAGAPDWRNAALIAPPPLANAPATASLDGGSAAEVVRRFRAAASPTAFQLACYLSAAWLNLPVMRLVQRVMLPESDTAHLAEVFLGGLLRAVSTEGGTADPETVQYDFLPGVRDELNSYLLRDEMLEVLRETSQFVTERFGQPLDFAALLADPEGAPLPALAGDDRPPLAYVAATVLAKLGGRYRALADRLATATGPAIAGRVTPSSVDMSTPDSSVTTVAAPGAAGMDRDAEHPQALTSNDFAAASRPAAAEQAAWEQRCRELLTIWPLPIVEGINPYDIGVFYSRRADAYRGGRPRPPYVPRAVDEELAALLRAQPLVMVKGQSRTGKSRTAFEIAARELPHWRLLVPKDRAALAGLRELERLPGEGELVLVWLDDLDRYLTGEGTGGLDARLLARLAVCDPPMKVLATIRLEEHARLVATEGEMGRSVRELLNRFDAGAITLPVGFDNPAERAAITELYPGEQVTGGLAEHLATDELVNIHQPRSEAISLDRSRERTGEDRPLDLDARIRSVDDLLPSPPIWFYDRELEIELLEQYLSDPAVRLVVIVGREGIGKTAMLSQLRESLQSDSSRLAIDGFVYLSAEVFRPITSEALLDDLRKILPQPESLTAERSKGSALTSPAQLDQLLEELQGTRVVVVIDNAEQLLDSRKQLRDPELDQTVQALLVRRDHAVTLVFVTREAPTSLLRAFPAVAYRINLEKGLPLRDAIDFMRKLDRMGVLGLRSAPVEHLERARQLTGGHPRALEALYSALATDPDTSLPQLLVELDELPSHQDVLDFLMGRVFDRLKSSDRRMVQALAVYGRPVPSAAVDYLLKPYLNGRKSGPALRRLLETRLIRGDGERFYLSPPDVERVLSHIPPGRPADRDRDPPPFTRLALLHRAANYLATTGKSPVERLSDLSAKFMEIDLRIRGEEHEAALRLITDVDDSYLRRWGYSNAVTSWRQALVGNLEDQRLELSNLVALGDVRREQDDQRRAMDYYHAASRIAEELPDNTLQIRLRTNLGNIHLEGGEVSRAANSFMTALDAARRYRLSLEEVRALGGLCLSNGQMGQFRQALERHTAALAIVDKLQDEDAQSLKAELLLNAGWLYGQIGRTEEALESFRWGRTLAHRRGEQLLEGHFFTGEAEVLIDDRDQARAIELASEAAAIGVRTENPRLSREANTILALAYLYGGNVDAARRAADTAARYRRASTATLGAFALQGITALRQSEQEAASQAFLDAHVQAEALLKRESRNFAVLDTDGLVLCGLVLCGDRDQLHRAVSTYRAARAVTTEPGVVRRSLRLLKELTRSDEADVLAAARSAAAGR
jgi:tetratricopeptide (TPR) repeat protein